MGCAGVTTRLHSLQYESIRYDAYSTKHTVRRIQYEAYSTKHTVRCMQFVYHCLSSILSSQDTVHNKGETK